MFSPSQVMEINSFYWSLDVPVNEIIAAFGFKNQHELLRVIGPCKVEWQCSYCDGDIEARTRSQLKAIVDKKRDFDRRGVYSLAQYEFDCCASCSQRLIQIDREMHEARSKRQREELDRNLRSLKGMPYRQYLQTEHWQNVRNSALKRARFKCQVCCSEQRLQVHHRTYARRGEELPEDLTVLCSKCHGVFHETSELAERGRADAR